MRKLQKAVVVLAFIMVSTLISPFMQPLVVMAEETQQSLEEQGFYTIRELFDPDVVTMTWNRTDRIIHIVVDDITIIFVPGSNIAHVNDVVVEMYHPIIMQQGTSYIYFYDFILVMEVAFFIFIEAEEANREVFELHLTEEARDLALYDFDYLIYAILENTPWKSVIYRRLGIDFIEYVEFLRETIEYMYPLISSLTLEEYEQMFGVPMYELWFPIRDGDDPRYIAANYLSYFLLYAVSPLGGIGHLSPRDLPMYRIQYSNLRIFYHQGGLDRETDPNNAMRLDILSHPSVRWFYGDVEVDLYADMNTVFPEVEGNIITEIIAPDEIAYIRINSFATSAEFDDLTIAPFFEEILDYEHLIIDIRGNGGGFMFNFTHNIMGRLIHEPVEIISYQFFSSGDLAVAAMDALLVSTSYIFDSIYGNDIYQWYTIDIVPAAQFIEENDMTYFNQDDLAYLEYVMVERNWIFPTGDGLTFDGKVWLLVDGGSASASSQATLLLMNTGLATVIGENTSGVMAAHSTYVILPNTGILFRIDIGYRTDAYGNSLEVYGIAPHVENFLGMDALETVLDLISDPNAWERAANRRDFDLAALFEDAYDVDFTGHPLIGTWVWDGDDSFIYEFRPDGTATRGFYNNRFDFYWLVYENNLFMDIGPRFMIEHWVFTITDGVLTIVSAQVHGVTWSYIAE